MNDERHEQVDEVFLKARRLLGQEREKPDKAAEWRAKLPDAE